MIQAGAGQITARQAALAVADALTAKGYGRGDRIVTITGNSATRAGGGIEAVAGSQTTLTRATLSENSTGDGPGNGGGLHLTGAGTVHVSRSVVTGNTAAAEGGGLWNSSAGVLTATGIVCARSVEPELVVK